MSPSPRRSRRAEELLVELGTRVEAARRLEAGGAEAVLRSIVEATVTLFGAEAASIALYDPSTDRLVFRVAAGEHGQGVVGLAVPPTQGLVGYVYQTGQAIALSDVERDSRFGRAFAQSTGYVPRSIVAVPLVGDSGTIGVLEVLDKRDSASFSLRDVELASVFARQAAVAISASRIERDTGALLAAVVAAWTADAGAGSAEAGAGGAEADPADAATPARLAQIATSQLAHDDETGLWALVDAVARVRRASPGQIALVTDLITVLADHASRAGSRSARRGAGRDTRRSE